MARAICSLMKSRLLYPFRSELKNIGVNVILQPQQHQGRYPLLPLSQNCSCILLKIFNFTKGIPSRSQSFHLPSQQVLLYHKKECKRVQEGCSKLVVCSLHYFEKCFVQLTHRLSRAGLARLITLLSDLVCHLKIF